MLALTMPEENALNAGLHSAKTPFHRDKAAKFPCGKGEFSQALHSVAELPRALRSESQALRGHCPKPKWAGKFTPRGCIIS